MLPAGRVFYSQSASLWLNILTSSVKLFPLYQKLRYRDIYSQWAQNRNRTLKRSTVISSFALCFQNPKSSVESVIRNTLKDTAHNDLAKKMGYFSHYYAINNYSLSLPHCNTNFMCFSAPWNIHWNLSLECLFCYAWLLLLCWKNCPSCLSLG